MPPRELSYILGNPPFGGKQHQSDEQKADMARVFADVKSAGVLDFVAAWYRKAADYMADNSGHQDRLRFHQLHYPRRTGRRFVDWICFDVG